MKLIIAIDPGRDKCGLAVVDLQGDALELALVTRANLAECLARLLDKWQTKATDISLIIGNGTQHKQVRQELEAYNPDWKITEVEEYGTTLAARELYWLKNKPSWWQRLIPANWRDTPPLDAYAAWAIAKLHIMKTL